MADASAADPALTTPLAPLGGRAPPAPDWFRRAVDTPHERAMVVVEGARIEWLAWGQRGRPGLLLLHGNGAHADWWRFTAPLWAADRRVAALSWSGMGGSDHRAAYRLDLFVDEALAVAEAAGLGERFAVLGHSFGGFPMMAMAARHGARLSQAIILDTPFHDRGPRREEERPRARGQMPYPSQEAALARFRWAPVQPTTHLFVADFIARHSLGRSETPEGPRWRWKFDPHLWHEFSLGDALPLLASPGCPVSLLWGEQSQLMPPERVADMRARLPRGTRAVPLPQAHHHVMADQPLALVAAVRALLA